MEPSVIRILTAFTSNASSIETMPSMAKKPEGKVIVVPAPEQPDTGRFSEDEGMSADNKDKPTEGAESSAPRVLLDGFTEQGYRSAPTMKPARRDPLNETDSREWRRDYQQEYRQNN